MEILRGAIISTRAKIPPFPLVKVNIEEDKKRIIFVAKNYQQRIRLDFASYIIE